MWMLTSDDDGHWYVIPVVMEQEFNDYVTKGGAPPEWARSLGGSPVGVQFPDGWDYRPKGVDSVTGHS